MIVRLTIAAVTVATALLSLPANAADAPLNFTVPPGQTVAIRQSPDGAQSGAPSATQPVVPTSPSTASDASPPKTFQLTITAGSFTQVCLSECFTVEPGKPFTLTVTAATLAEALVIVQLPPGTSNFDMYSYYDFYMIISVNNGPPAYINFDFKAARDQATREKVWPPFSTYLPPAVLAQFKAPSC